MTICSPKSARTCKHKGKAAMSQRHVEIEISRNIIRFQLGRHFAGVNGNIPWSCVKHNQPLETNNKDTQLT